MKNGLDGFIEENKEEMFTIGGVSDEQIFEMEQDLGLELRNEIRFYLSRYGLIMGYGVEILGGGKDGTSSMVEETVRFRKKGLANEYVVIRNVDEWIYCINNNTGVISSWDQFDKIHLSVGNNFEDYILGELIIAKDDWNE